MHPAPTLEFEFQLLGIHLQYCCRRQGSKRDSHMSVTSTPLPWTTPFHGRAQVGANLLTPAASPPLVAEVDSIPDDISALLNDLHSNHINTDGTPLEKDAEYEEVLGRQQVARREYLQELLLYREQREIIIDGRGQLNEQDKQKTSKTLKKSDTSPINALATVPAATFIDLDRILNVAECAHTLNTGASALVDETDPARVRFSLSREDLFLANFSAAEYEQAVRSAQHSIIPIIEDRFRQRCEQMLHSFGATQESRSANAPVVSLTTAKAWHLCKALQESATQRDIALAQRADATDRVERAQRDTIEALRDTLALCVSTLESDKCRLQAEHDATIIEFLLAKSEATAAKLENLKYDVLRRTYTNDSMPALTEIKASMDRHETRVLTDLKHAQERLQQYRALTASGSEQSKRFLALVGRFAEVKEQIETTKEQLRHARQM